MERPLEKPPVEQGIYIEDCALSGHEFCQVAGILWPDSELISDEWRLANVDLRFAVLSNGAEVVIQDEIERRNLANVRINTDHCARITTVTPDGALALHSNEFYSPDDNCTLNPRRLLSLPLFNDWKNWGGIERAKTARRILRRIGKQLYLQQFEEAGLGAGGLGLTLTLARSVPKSTLPVLWAKGDIIFSKKYLQWEPLFKY